MNGIKKHILLVTPDMDIPGGVAETVRLLAHELEEKAHVRIKPYGRRFGQKGLSRYLMPVRDILGFVLLLFRRRFDVIHMNPSLNLRSVFKEFPLLIMFYLFGYSGRVLIFIHGWEQDFFNSIAEKKWAAAVFANLINWSGTVLVLSEKFRKCLLGIGVEGDTVRTITTMVNLSELPPALKGGKQCRTILYLSRLIREKGVYETVEAFSRLTSRFPDLKLIMAGEGPERAGLEKMIAVKGLSNVELPGYIRGREKFEALEKSCIFLLPTRYGEGCPVALLEAMGAGLVPVVTDAGGITEIIQPGKNAVLIPEVSAEALENAVETLVSDPGAIERMSAEAAEYAADHFSSAKVTEIIFGCYGHMIPKSSKRTKNNK